MRNLLLRFLVTPTTVLPGPPRPGYDVKRVFVPRGMKLVFDGSGDDCVWRYVEREPKLAA